VAGGSWLFPDGVDRERMLEMDRHLAPVRRAAFAVLAAALIVSGPWVGWWTIVPLGLAAVGFRAADAWVERTRKPEYAIFAAWAASQLIIAASVAVTGGPAAPMLVWLALPLVTLGARFSERGIAVGVLFSVGLLLAVAFGVNAQAVLENPPLLFAPISLMVSIALFQTVLMRSDVKHRAEALGSRAAELEQQSLVTRQPVAIVLCDIDRFKQINDTHGHATGDAVLKDVAYELRKALRAFDLVYRCGGEEFLVLVPGASVRQATELAEDLRAAVTAEPRGGGIGVTVSFGVAASNAEAPFDYTTVFAAADAALYAAKRGGRDRVCSAGDVLVAAA
jgi:diguanylate cyclase (GGDEF)-like protein